MADIFKDLDLINKSASFFMERSKVIQGNIANANTPFYKPVDITFQQILANQTKIKTTNDRHINPESKDRVNFVKIESGYITGYDQNKVIVEEEMAKLAESSIMYKTAVEIMKKEMAKLKYAISGR
ncbi:MAG: flagellar basal body rod protein FlgB [Hydrogenothermaceae bacterium]